MKLFQLNPTNYITLSSVAAITLEPQWAIILTDKGIKHRVTLEQARVLLSCFEVIKPIIDVPEDSSSLKLILPNKPTY